MARFVAKAQAEPVIAGRGKQRAWVVAGQFAADEIAAAVCWSTARVQAELAKVALLRASQTSPVSWATVRRVCRRRWRVRSPPRRARCSTGR